ncbi:hypothetical protein ACFE04_005249 [Oxalis oulophora]
MGGTKLACVVIIFVMVVGALLGEAEITCKQVTQTLKPCISYLKGGSMNSACCPAIKSLNAAAKTTSDHKAACNCLKSAAKSIVGLHYDLAEGLPAKCHVSIAYKIALSTDCNK